MSTLADRPVILWLRRELRLHDNAALAAAVASRRPVLPVFVLDRETPGDWAPGAASLWWLHLSLQALAADLGRTGATLVLRRGRSADMLARLVAESGATAIHAGHPVEPWARRLLDGLAAAAGVPVHLARTVTLYEPGSVRTKTGGGYGVFTPFSRACLAQGEPAATLPAPTRIQGATAASEPLESWGLLPTRPDWAAGLRETWRPGEHEAMLRLRKFADDVVAGYGDSRNLPGVDGTAMLSPRLHWGEISPAQAWHAARAAAPEASGTATWINELLWREFSADLLWHHPDLPEQPLRREFAAMPWRQDAAALRAWQRGRTGIPIVDAGMRQLWQIGWMHNRVRMITASFLVKHLLIHWREGALWFWDTLVDADLASNSAQWQWVAGCGADAAPFFRIFNPVLQGQKFDADGGYVRRWVPELARLPDRHLHAPWEAPAEVLAGAGVVLGRDYPRPVVDLARGRERALAAFKALRLASAA